MKRHLIIAIICTSTLVVTLAVVAYSTSSFGFVASTILARGPFTSPINGHSDNIVLQAHQSTDHVVQNIVWGAGASSGWHRHPGIVVATVQSGAVAFYDEDCQRHVIAAGQSFWESGPDAGLVRNEGMVDAVVYSTYLVPAGVALRIDMPNPGCLVD